VSAGRSAVTIDPGSVRVAVLVDDDHGYHPNFMDSWNPMLAADLGGQQRVWRGGYAFQRCTSAGVVEGRNEVAKNLLSSTAEWLLFVDADMGWDHTALEDLMAVADPVARPIVGGLCFGFGPITDRMDHANAVVKVPFPTIFDLVERDDDFAFRPRFWYKPNSVVECSATGAAMLLIHRTVFEAIAAKPELGQPFDRMKHPRGKKLWGEDTSFCARAKMCGFPTYVHTGVKTSHAKTVYVTESTFLAQVRPQPATEQVAVVVPVMNRPQNARPFMESLRASTGLAAVYAIADPDDPETYMAWIAAGAEVLLTETGRSSFPQKANFGYAHTSEPWLLVVGDDVRFHPGWLDHAQQTAAITGADLVATNDLGNRRVADGFHATHPMIRRTYIDEQGASWDGPGVLVHEGYRHNFCDDEWSAVARQRGVFAPALGALVEHNHPIFGKAEDDVVYRKGKAHYDQDRRLFERRLRDNTQASA